MRSMKGRQRCGCSRFAMAHNGSSSRPTLNKRCCLVVGTGKTRAPSCTVDRETQIHKLWQSARLRTRRRTPAQVPINHRIIAVEKLVGLHSTGPTSDTSSSPPLIRDSGLWFQPGFWESFKKST
jgi:hypothetical protein